jgi:hypothetical protein
VSFHARAGFENIRAALVEEPPIDDDLPLWPEAGPGDANLIELPEYEPLDDREPELVGAAIGSAPGPVTRARLRTPTLGRRPRMHRTADRNDAI